MKAGRGFGDGGPYGVVEQDSSRLDMTILGDGVRVRPVVTVRFDVLTRTVLGADVTFKAGDTIPID